MQHKAQSSPCTAPTVTRIRISSPVAICRLRSLREQKSSKQIVRNRRSDENSSTWQDSTDSRLVLYRLCVCDIRLRWSDVRYRYRIRAAPRVQVYCSQTDIYFVYWSGLIIAIIIKWHHPIIIVKLSLPLSFWFSSTDFYDEPITITMTISIAYYRLVLIIEPLNDCKWIRWLKSKIMKPCKRSTVIRSNIHSLNNDDASEQTSYGASCRHLLVTFVVFCVKIAPVGWLK